MGSGLQGLLLSCVSKQPEADSFKINAIVHTVPKAYCVAILIVLS